MAAKQRDQAKLDDAQRAGVELDDQLDVLEVFCQLELRPQRRMEEFS